MLKVFYSLLFRFFGARPLLYLGDIAITDRWKWLISNCPQTAVHFLDAGCGSGAFSLCLAERNLWVTGISFSKAEISKAMERSTLLKLSNTKFLKADLRELNQMSFEQVFDSAICLETIEHLLDDHALLSSLSDKMRTGGRLYITTPNIDCPPLRGDKLSQTEDGGHVRWGYSFQSLENLLEKCGFQVVHRDELTGVVHQKIINLERLLSPYTPRIILIGLISVLRLFSFCDRSLTRTLGKPFFSIAIVAEKKMDTSKKF